MKEKEEDQSRVKILWKNAFLNTVSYKCLPVVGSCVTRLQQLLFIFFKGKMNTGIYKMKMTNVFLCLQLIVNMTILIASNKQC